MKHKKLYTTLKAVMLTVMAVSFMAIAMNAQTVHYSLDFESGIPADVTLIDNDGLTPAANVAAYSAAWTPSTSATLGNGTQVAVSNSWYSPAGTADDWMILPSMTIPAGSYLKWDAKAQDANYPDGYEIYLAASPTVAAMTATTAAFSIAAENSTFTTRTLDLSAYVGQTLHIGFRNNSTDKFLLVMDNIEVVTPTTIDATTHSIDMPNFMLAGSVDVKASFTNLGGTLLHTMTYNYSVDGGAPVTQNVTGLGVNYTETYNFTHNTPVNLGVGGHEIKVWLSNLNANIGVPDDNVNNDTATIFVSVLSSIPAKQVVLADHSGAWCQFCPDGTVILDGILAGTNGPSVNGATIHNGDAMTIPDAAAIQQAYIGGYPNGTVDRYKFSDQTDVGMSRTDWDAKVVERLGHVVPLSVSFDNVGWDDATRTITATLSANALGDIKGDYRFNVYVMENGVTGTGSGYDQVNAYNTQAGHPYFGAGNPIVGFVHNHTVRAMLGGSWGQQGSLPANITAGSNNTYTFTYALPAGYVREEIHLLGMVMKYNADDVNDRAILNSVEGKLTVLTSTERTFEDVAVLNIFPNPASDAINIEMDLEENSDVVIELVNLQGQVIRTMENSFMNTGFHNVRWGIDKQIANGMYFVRISANEVSTMRKVSILR